MKLFTHLVYLVVIVAVATYAWSRSPTLQPAPAETTGSANYEQELATDLAEPTPALVQGSEDTIIELVRANEQLQRELEELQQVLEVFGEERGQSPANAFVSPLNERMGLDFARLDTEPGYLNDLLESRPANYERDTQLELVLNDTFVAEETLRSLRVSELKCRGLLCVIDIDAPLPDNFDQGLLHSRLRNEHVLSEGLFGSVTTVQEDSIQLILGFEEKQEAN